MNMSGEYETPQPIFDKLNREFGFIYDVCATRQSSKCLSYFGPDRQYPFLRNALKLDWYGRCPLGSAVLWMNPPYSNPYPWCKKAYEEALKGATVVALLNCGMNTKWFHEFCMKAAEIRFCDRRINFWMNGKAVKGNPRDSMIVVWEPPRICFLPDAWEPFGPRVSTFKVPNH